jgi:hypothetical protein
MYIRSILSSVLFVIFHDFLGICFVVSFERHAEQYIRHKRIDHNVLFLHCLVHLHRQIKSVVRANQIYQPVKRLRVQVFDIMRRLVDKRKCLHPVIVYDPVSLSNYFVLIDVPCLTCMCKIAVKRALSRGIFNALVLRETNVATFQSSENILI